MPESWCTLEGRNFSFQRELSRIKEYGAAIVNIHSDADKAARYDVEKSEVTPISRHLKNTTRNAAEIRHQGRRRLTTQRCRFDLVRIGRSAREPLTTKLPRRNKKTELLHSRADSSGRIRLIYNEEGTHAIVL